MSPYHLAWEDENYYCIGFYEKIQLGLKLQG